MASLVLTNASVIINSVDLSAFVQSVTINAGAELVDATTMGDTTRKSRGGLRTWSIDVEFTQSFGVGAVDATLFGLVGATFPVSVQPVAGAATATNPRYSGTGILESYTPIGNAVGDLAVAPVTIQSAGPLTRATA